MHPARRLTLVTPSLGAGGAERVVQGLAVGFVDAGHEVSVVTTTSRPDFYALDPRVRRTAIDLTGASPGLGGSIRRVPSMVRQLAPMIRELGAAIDATDPHLVVTFMEDINVLGLMACAGRHPVVVTEHNDPRHHTTARVWRALRRTTYGRAACLVSVSEGVDRAFGWLPPEKRRVIHNPLPTPMPGHVDRALDMSGPLVAGMGRLTRQKGFDLLIEAFAAVAHEHPEWSLVIVGEGPDRPELEALVVRLGLTGRVHLPGRRRNPLADLSSAELFALPSRWEGFGNVVAEALSVGVPVVSFDCPSGPGEIIDDGRTGLLVEPGNVAELARAIDTLIRDPARRGMMAAAAPASVAHLQIDRVVERWEEQVLSGAVASAGSP